MIDPAQQNERDLVMTMVRYLLYLVFIVVGYLVLSALSPVLAPLLAAGGIAYLLDPLVDKLERRGVKRSLACLLVLLAFIGVIVGAIALLVPMMSRDIERFVAKLPGMIEQATMWLSKTFEVEVPHSWREYLEGEKVQEFLKSAAGPLARMAASMVGGVFTFLAHLAELLLIPVFAFYLLLDWDHTMHRLLLLVPARHRKGVGLLARDIDSVVSGWVRGQFTVVALLAFLYAVSFSVIGINLAIPIGLLVGLLTIVPFVGTFVGAGITALVIMLDFQGWGVVAAVGGVFVVLHLLEAAILTPVMVGKRVGLGEASALFAVVAGGKLLGLTGIILAVPLAASVGVIMRRAIKFYESTEFFTDGVPAPEPGLGAAAEADAIAEAEGIPPAVAAAQVEGKHESKHEPKKEES